MCVCVVCVLCVCVCYPGAPILDSLNLKGTSVNRYDALSRLPCLSSLCLSHCPIPQDASALSYLSACSSLRDLSLAGMKIPSKWLRSLKGVALVAVMENPQVASTVCQCVCVCVCVCVCACAEAPLILEIIQN